MILAQLRGRLLKRLAYLEQYENVLRTDLSAVERDQQAIRRVLEMSLSRPKELNP